MGDQKIVGIDGAECVLSGAVIHTFASELQGTLLAREHPDYDSARRVWNGSVDKWPALIVRCSGTGDVVACVRLAREHDLLVSVRGGGHNIAGKSVCDGGLMIDLSPMNGIVVDPHRETARVQGGAKLGDMDRATQAFGLATTAGVVSTTGVAGLTLGGGMGRLGRKYGLACDNLISAEVVTADGRVLTANMEENADLFWALRGGGANVGIVTSFEFRLHPVGPIVYGGLAFYPISQARDMLRRFNDFCRTAPDEVRVEAGLLTSPEGDPLIAISTCYIGLLDQAERTLQPLRGLASAIRDQIGPKPYLEIQAAADDIFPTGLCFYWKSHFVKEFSEAAIDETLARFAKAPSPRSVVILEQWGGAVARVADDATAFGHRDVAYDFIPASIWTDPTDSERQIAWVREFWEATKPFGTGGVYVNNLGEEGDDRVLAAYGFNYRRLAAVKAQYDPGNFFRLNQNVRPSL